MNALPEILEPRLALPTHVRYHVLAWLCVATAIAYIDRGCIAVASEVISADLGLSDKEMGTLMSAFFMTYALFQLPTGWLGHVWGTRKALPFFSLAWSTATAVAALATGLPTLLAARLALGAAESGIFPCAASSLGKWFPSTRRAWVSGILGSFMGIGGALGAYLTGLLLTVMDWRWMLALYAVPGLLWAAWFYIWFRDRPQDHSAVNQAELDLITDQEPVAIEINAPTPWAALFASPVLWWINGQQFFRAASYAFYVTWFPKFLQKTYGVDVLEAGTMTSLPHWAALVGSLGGGLMADWVLVRTGSRRLSRQGVAGVSLAASAVLVVLAYPLANVWLFVLVICASSLCSALAGPAAYAVTIDVGGKQVAPAFSIMNMSGNVGAILFAQAVPYLVEYSGSWDLVLFFFAGMYLLAALCWLFIDPNRSIVAPPDPSPSRS